ncbi:MAG: hypothetical protein AAGI01_04995 [Myxococcota bacterium]
MSIEYDEEQEAFEPIEDEEEAQRRWREALEDPERAQRLLRGLESLIPDILKRGGLGTLLHEEKLKERLREKNIPKEIAGLMLSQANSMRREILRIISREIRVFLSEMDFGGEISKILTAVSFEIKTEIRFIPNDQAALPKIKTDLKVTGSDGLDDVLAAAAGAASAGAEAEEGERAERRQGSSAKIRKVAWSFLKKNEAEGDES